MVSNYALNANDVLLPDPHWFQYCPVRKGLVVVQSATHVPEEKNGVFMGQPPINGIPLEYMLRFFIPIKLFELAIFYIYIICISSVC